MTGLGAIDGRCESGSGAAVGSTGETNPGVATDGRGPTIDTAGSGTMADSETVADSGTVAGSLLGAASATPVFGTISEFPRERRAGRVEADASSTPEPWTVDLGVESPPGAGSVVGSAAGSAAGASAGDPPREPVRGAVRASERDEATSEEEESLLGPVAPSDPVVSAKAAGMATIADPTPRAMAKAPTRPT
jgi:hypothetical protein